MSKAARPSTKATTGSGLSEEELAAIAQAAAGNVVPGPQAGSQAVAGRRASVSVAMGESGPAAAAAAAAATAAAAAAPETSAEDGAGAQSAATDSDEEPEPTTEPISN